jgi:hypothetical protein
MLSEYFRVYGSTIWFAIYVGVWATITTEFWKRKQAILHFQMGVNEGDVDSYSRPEFVADRQLPKQRSRFLMGKVSLVPNRLKRNLIRLASLPIYFTIIGVVIAIFITLSLIKSSDMLKEYEYGQLYVSGAQGLAITVMNAVYNIVARWFTDLENHRFDGNYEASLMMKTFCFQFVNSYLSLFWLAFYERDRSKLAVQLIMLVLIKSASDYFLFLVKPLAINALDKWRKGIRYVSREKRRRAEVARKLVRDLMRYFEAKV